MLNPEHDNARASVVYQRIVNDERTNQIRGFVIDHDKFLLMRNIQGSSYPNGLIWTPLLWLKWEYLDIFNRSLVVIANQKILKITYNNVSMISD